MPTGKVINAAGEHLADVDYSLGFHRNMIPTGLGQDIPGIMTIDLRIHRQSPPLRFVSEKLTLVMEDSKRLDFFMRSLSTGGLY